MIRPCLGADDPSVLFRAYAVGVLCLSTEEGPAEICAEGSDSSSSIDRSLGRSTFSKKVTVEDRDRPSGRSSSHNPKGRPED